MINDPGEYALFAMLYLAVGFIIGCAFSAARERKDK